MIEISVATRDAEKALKLLPVLKHSTSSCRERQLFSWERLSTRRGDDEGVVFELSRIFPGSKVDWEIDWERSVF